MRIALVTPYSWTYPGGVTRHVEALAGQLLATGHEVRVLAPYDPDDRHAKLMHRGARPHAREAPDWFVPLGRSVGIPSNGAVSNVSLTPESLTRARRAIEGGRFDVVHVHEPIAPVPARDALRSARTALVGTFHAYSTNPISNGIGARLGGGIWTLNKLHARIAVSEAAAWTAKRYYGGRYTIIPNGVDVPPRLPAKPPADHLRIVFVGQAVERKGLPVLLRAFEALREHIPAELRIIGAGEDDVAHLALDRGGITVLGGVDDATKQEELARADVLCAPSLGGESFGMVLTEAFAAGTPVVASDIAGYRDVVTDDREGRLVPPGDATALAATLRDLWDEPDHRATLRAGAAAAAPRFAWPRVAREVEGVYEEAIDLAAAPATATAERVGRRVGIVPADGRPQARPGRLPSLERGPGRRRPVVAALRRVAVLLGLVLAVGLAYLALQRVGPADVASSLLGSSPGLVVLALGLMCASMGARAISWYAILRAALPRARVRLFDALQGTSIGVLMSATLPARLGEPSRALIVARRTGRPRDHLPIVLGTMVSQTLLNLVALAGLGAAMFSTVQIFHGHEHGLLLATAIPVFIVLCLLLAPIVLGGATGRSRRMRLAMTRLRGTLGRVRSGLVVFRRPKLGAVAVLGQLGAWAIQWASCWALLCALGLNHQVSPAAAAAVLFAVNVTAVIPATPSNLGVFQAACVAVLHGGYHVSTADALGYGIVLQAVEIATAVIMGGPALVKEGLSWRDVRLRAMHAAPVTLPARSSRGASEAEA